MSERPDLSDPAVILGLPRYAFGRAEYVVDDKGEVHHGGRVIRATPGNRITIPIAPPSMMVASFEPTDLIFVVDENGVAWKPVLTVEGWMRDRLRS